MLVIVAMSLVCTMGGKPVEPAKQSAPPGHVQCTFDGEVPEGAELHVWIRQDGKDSEHRTGTALDPFLRGTDFQACRNFVIEGRLVQGGADVWTTSIPARAKCRKPRKLAAKLSCSYVAADGTVVAYPGNGKKLRPRLDDTLACWVVGPKKAPDNLTATIAGHPEPLWQDDDTMLWSSAQMLFPDDDFTTCDPFTVTASIANGDGQVVWSGKLPIPQSCPD